MLQTLVRPPDTPTALALFHEMQGEIGETRPLKLRLGLRRLLDSFLALWASNRYLQGCYERAKQENAGLHNFLAAIIKRHGELRFTQEELGAAAWDHRIRGFCVPGSTDVMFRISDEETLFKRAPRWLAEAIEGRPVPELTLKGEQLFLPVFDITDLDGTKPKALS